MPLVTAFPTQQSQLYPYSFQAMPSSMRPSPVFLYPRPLSSSMGTVIPSPAFVDAQLPNSKAVPVGMKYGLVFGALGALPIWGIEQFFQKNKNQRINLIQLLVSMGEGMIRPKNPKWSLALAQKMNSRLHNFLLSATGTMTVGVIAGGTLGWWGVTKIKNKLKAIHTMKQEQQAGTYKPKPLTWMHRCGLSNPSTNNPEQDYQNLLKTDLDPAQAFKIGALEVGAFKIAPSICSLVGVGGSLVVFKLFKPSLYKQITQHPQFKEAVYTFLHPVFIAKMAALPVIGGFIAQQIAPWFKGQLGLSGYTSG